MNIFKALKNAIIKEEKGSEALLSKDRIVPYEISSKYQKDPEFPYLVSFSRTGSHWLRMLMELYFEKPSMTLLFFSSVKDAKGYTCYHTHDLDLKVEARNVIYLYRDPVDTIFSQMTFHDQDMNSLEYVDAWTELYAKHVHKWLIGENFTLRKTIVTYEGMRKDLSSEMKKISELFNVPFNEEKLKNVSERVSKEAIKEKTAHDPKVINLDSDYPNNREAFRKKYAERIYQKTFELFPDLKNHFSL